MRKTIRPIIFISILVLLLFYVFQVNALTRETYLIQGYEEKLGQLSEEKEALEINFSRVNSLANIENYLQGQNFEKVSQAKYIYILETSVAAK